MCASLYDSVTVVRMEEVRPGDRVFDQDRHKSWLLGYDVDPWVPVLGVHRTGHLVSIEMDGWAMVDRNPGDKISVKRE